MTDAVDPPSNGVPAGPSDNVLPFPVTPTHGPEFRLRADATLSLGARLAGNDDAILRALRLQMVGPETSLSAAVEAPMFWPVQKASKALDELRVSHSAAPFYLVEVIRRCEWANVPAGETLLVAPAAKLRSLGLCIAAFNDDRPPGLRLFVSGRDWAGKRLWLLGGSEARVDPAKDILALHPILGSVKEAMEFDSEYAWAGLAAELLRTPDSLWSGTNPTWRPGSALIAAG